MSQVVSLLETREKHMEEVESSLENSASGTSELSSGFEPGTWHKEAAFSEMILEEGPNEFVDEEINEEDSLEYIGAVSKILKRNVIDLIAYEEFFKPKFEEMDILEDVEDLAKEGSGIEVVETLREGGLYDEIIEFGEGSRKDSIIDGRIQYSGAVMADVYFRGGKGLRSTLGQVTDFALTGNVSSETLVMSTMIELLHTSTLLQDDYLDGDRLRRGRLSCPALEELGYGRQDLAVLDGNELEAWTNQMNTKLEDLEVPQESREIFNTVQSRVNQGQSIDMENWDLSESEFSDYEEMSWLKTGILYYATTGMVLEHVAERNTRIKPLRALEEHYQFAREKLGAEENSWVPETVSYPISLPDFIDERLGKQDYDEEAKNIKKYSRFFNIDFQGRDDYIEAYGHVDGKSDTDIPNREVNLVPILVDEFLTETVGKGAHQIAREIEGQAEVESQEAESYAENMVQEARFLKNELENLYDDEEYKQDFYEEIAGAVENIAAIRRYEGEIDNDVRRLDEAYIRNIFDVAEEYVERVLFESAEHSSQAIEEAEEQGMISSRGRELYGKMAEAVAERTE